MIKIFKDYYDKNGSRYKVISFNGDKYACQSYHNGKCVYLNPGELFDTPPVRPTKVKFTDIVREERKSDNEELIEAASEPVYIEPSYDNKNIKEDESVKNDFKDNTEETADDDFYADF